LIRGCAWPFISDVQTLNAFYPDTNATYWVAPYIALPGSQLIVHGTYPNGRFMSLDTYDRLGESVGAIYDAAIEPDAGDTNPFVDPAAGPGGRFTVTIIPPQDLPPTPPATPSLGRRSDLPTVPWWRKATSSTACTSPMTPRSSTAGSRSRA
jgi:hypothetical protein